MKYDNLQLHLLLPNIHHLRHLRQQLLNSLLGLVLLLVKCKVLML
jgi:hypothetical protein